MLLLSALLGAIVHLFLPVFFTGLPVLFEITGGYLFGMILCVYVVTTMREKFVSL